MGNSFQERLSAWTDDELGQFELRRVTDELVKSDEARRRVKRYQFIGAAMRDEPDVVFDVSLRERIMAEIDALPEEEQWDRHGQGTTSLGVGSGSSPRQRIPWLKMLVGGAIAASVALISLTVLKHVSQQAGSREPVPMPMAATDQSRQTPAPQPAMGPNLATGRVSSELARPVSSAATMSPVVAEPIPPSASHQGTNIRLLGGYLATHAEQASRRGVLPRARVMGFDLPDVDADAR